MGILEETNQKRKYEDRVRGLFFEMDKDMSGSVSWEEFKQALQNPHVEAYLSFIELDHQHLRDIFMLLDEDGSGCIEVDELLKGVDDLRGPATRVQTKSLHILINDLIVSYESLVERLGELSTRVVAAERHIIKASNPSSPSGGQRSSTSAGHRSSLSAGQHSSMSGGPPSSTTSPKPDEASSTSPPRDHGSE